MQQLAGGQVPHPSGVVIAGGDRPRAVVVIATAKSAPRWP